MAEKKKTTAKKTLADEDVCKLFDWDIEVIYEDDFKEQEDDIDFLFGEMSDVRDELTDVWCDMHDVACELERLSRRNTVLLIVSIISFLVACASLYLYLF